MPDTSDLSALFDKHRVLVCVGAGGVGKTTVAAALALSAAASGKRTLCLTIDPARRLASSLGLPSFPKEELPVPNAFFESHSLQVEGSLTVMMLDARGTFDALIRRFAPSETDADRILSHRVYGHLTENLAGTQAYMAMEKVLSVMRDEKYDLVILDTPPSARALDFFDAPDRMARILDSPATRALVAALQGGSILRLGILGAGLRVALRGLERLTGPNLLRELAELLSSMNSLFGGFEERASRVHKSLRSEEFGYVLVTAPLSRTVSDAIGLAQAMKKRGLAIGATVFNRSTTPALRAALGPQGDCVMPPSISSTAQVSLKELYVENDRRHREELDLEGPLLEAVGDAAKCAHLPKLADDVHSPELLMKLARLLTPSRLAGP